MTEAGDRTLDILFVLDKLSGGGAERVAVHLMNELAARGHHVRLLLFNDRGVLRDLPSPSIPRIHLDSLRARQAVLPMIRTMGRLRPRLVISFLPSANILSLLGAMLSRCGARVVITEHAQPTGAGTGNVREGHHIAYLLARRLYRRAAALVCCSPGLRNAWIGRAGLREDQVHAILNPVITPGLDAASREAPGHPWAGDGGPPLVVAASRLAPEKDMATLLRAFARLRARRPVRLLLMGEGAERPALEALVRQLGIGAEVDMPGYCANPLAVFRRADVLALSSTDESFPTVMVEALACGLPVVTTRCMLPVDQRLADGWVHASVPVGDDAVLAEALGRALDDPGDRAALPGRVAGMTQAASADAYEALLRTLDAGPAG